MARKKQTRSSWGSLNPVRKGVWRLRYVRNTPEGRKRVSETIYGSKRDAERVKAERRVEAEAPPVPTVEQVFDKYIRPQMEKELRPNTLRQYESVWNKYVQPRWASCPMDQVHSFDIQEWLNELPGAQARHALATLRRITAWGVTYEVINRDPGASKFSLPETEKRNRKVYTLEELIRVWEHTKGSIVEAPFLLAAHAGLRVGEAMAVRRDALEFAEDEGQTICRVHVERQLIRGGMTELLKTDSSHRTAVLVEPWSVRMMELCEGLEDDEYLCSTPAGLASQDLIRKRWRAAVNSSGLPYIPFRNLRNSYETYMHWQEGVELKTVSRLMGHVTVKTTLKHYDRPDSEVVVRNALHDLRQKQN